MSGTTVLPQPTVVPQETVAGRLTVDERLGYLRLPNTILDGLLPLLDPFAQLVYLRLYRLTHGFDRPTCLVSFETLAQSTRLSKSSVIRAIGELESKGLVSKHAQICGRRAERGNVYEVHLPTIVPQTIVRSGTTVRSERTVVPQTRMKDLKEKHEKAPVAVAPAPDKFEIRTMAARIFEARRHEHGFDRDRLREAVEIVLLGEGRPVDDATIEEAIRGMLS